MVKRSKYLKSFRGVRKILEIILEIVNAGSVGYFWGNYGGKTNDTNGAFMKAFVLSSVGIVIALLLLLFMFCLCCDAESDCKATTAFVHIFLAIVQLTVLGLLTYTRITFGDRDICENLKTDDDHSQCKQLTTGIVSGFLASVLLCIDGCYCCCRRLSML